MAKYAAYIGTTENGAAIRIALESSGGMKLAEAIARRRHELLTQVQEQNEGMPERILRNRLGVAAGLLWVEGLFDAARKAVDNPA